MKQVSCPALVVTAPSSGSGKTTVVAAIARHFTNLGKTVRVFKTGPDFIDPAFLSLASKQPVYQLDFWMCGESHCKRLVWEAAQNADLILIEGVMGMFDGQCSSADIAATLGIPALCVIDAGKMAQTFGAVAHGLATYRKDVEMYGVIANRVASPGHSSLLQESLPTELHYYGYLPKDLDISLPERHLGLVQAQELDDIESKLDSAAKQLAEHSHIELPPAISFYQVDNEAPESGLKGVKIAIAQDQAFSFIYQANLDLLHRMGARLCFFSPTEGDELPNCDALYLPGGYPELHLFELADNVALKKQIKKHAEQGKPILAECGGMLFLNKQLIDADGAVADFCGVMDAHSQMQTKLAALGLVEAEFQSELTLRGHTFHYSTTTSKENELCKPISQRGKAMDPVWSKKNTIASYIHWYFPSNPVFVAKLFRGEFSLNDF